MIARPALERALSTALNIPVSIEELSWTPFEGQVTAGHVSVGDGSDRIAAERLFVAVRLGERLGAIEVELASASGRF